MEKKNNSGLLVLIIILVIAVCGMGAYIAYDKFGGTKQPDASSKQENEQDVKEVQKVSIANLYKSVDLDYAINGKIVKVGFNYAIEEGKNDYDYDSYKVYVTLSFDGKVNENLKFIVDEFATENEYKSSEIYEEIGRKNLNVIKGSDKEYFVFFMREFTESIPNRLLVVLKDNGDKVGDIKFESGNSIFINDSHYENWDMHYLTNDAIYYVDNSCGAIKEIAKVGYTAYTTTEYKAIIVNDKLQISKGKTYESTDIAGQTC